MKIIIRNDNKQKFIRQLKVHDKIRFYSASCIKMVFYE